MIRDRGRGDNCRRRRCGVAMAIPCFIVFYSVTLSGYSDVRGFVKQHSASSQLYASLLKQAIHIRDHGFLPHLSPWCVQCRWKISASIP